MKQRIIQTLANDKFVEKTIQNISDGTFEEEDLQDLAQDIYMILLEKDDELIEELFEKKQLNFYTARLILNNLNSRTSRFYYKYIKDKNNSIRLQDWNEEDREFGYKD